MGGENTSDSVSRAATVLPPDTTQDKREMLDDRYAITRMIGRGGMGSIYLGEDCKLQKRVAIKMLHGNVAFNGEEVQRFHREAIAISQIGNPHIVSATDIGKMRDGRTFIVLELLEGQNLRSAIADGPMDIKRAMMIAQQALDAVGAAHAAGFIHRDLKPENIFLTKQRNGDDFVKLLDFGVAAMMTPGTDTKLTQTGNLIGTPVYMAPEQARAKAFDHRIDIYAIGVVLFEMLTGTQPFKGDSLYELLCQVVTDPLPSVTKLRPDVPPWLEAVVCRATAKNVDDRYPTAEAFLRALPMSRATFGLAAVTPGTVAKIISRPLAKSVPAVKVAAPAASPPAVTVAAQANTLKIAMGEQAIDHLGISTRQAPGSPNLGYRRIVGPAVALVVIVGGVFAWQRWRQSTPVLADDRAQVTQFDAQPKLTTPPLADENPVLTNQSPTAPSAEPLGTSATIQPLPIPTTVEPLPTTPKPVGNSRPTRAPDQLSAGTPACDAAALATEAQRWFSNGFYVDALRLYEATMRCTGKTTYARVAGIAACKSNNAARARFWYRSAGNHASVAQSCLQQSPQIQLSELSASPPSKTDSTTGLTVEPVAPKAPKKAAKSTVPRPVTDTERNQTIDPFAKPAAPASF